MGRGMAARALGALGLVFASVGCGDGSGLGPDAANGAGPGGRSGLEPPRVEEGEWRGLTAQGTTVGFAVADGGVKRVDLAWRLGACELRQTLHFDAALPIRDSSLTTEVAMQPGDSRATFELTFAGGDRALGLLRWNTAGVPDQPGCSGLGEAVFTAAPVAKGGEKAP